MAKLTTKERNSLPSSDFVEPKQRKYPIEDRSHARNALARVSQHGSDREKSMVRSAAHRKYGMGKAQMPKTADILEDVGSEIKANPPKILSRTGAKFGPGRAEKQRVAILLSKARRQGAKISSVKGAS